MVSVFAVGDARLIPACAGKTPHPPIGARARRAHPRVCGENGARGGVVVLVAGSSPRVRGKPQVRQDRVRTRGLIPACAGKTPTRAAPTLRSPAHPRVCGENTAAVMPTPTACGSSPRVRGKRFRRVEPHPGLGLIPACAGKTRWTCTPKPVSAAHPRVCGENLEDAERIVHEAGSSPRVRGKPVHGGHPHTVTRLIPACAGKTFPDPAKTSIPAAHPRVCGENPFPSRRAPHVAGSSPRVRGKHAVRDYKYKTVRLIPACAGKTPEATMLKRSQQAHPRVCGENMTISLRASIHRGSSPRVRGKPSQRPRASAPGRLIPACAGKTRRRCMARRPLAAHPRVCGENPRRGPAAPTTPGSSPRVRGKLPLDADKRHSLRLIPACAGKTRTAPSGRASPTAHPRVCGENEAMGRPSLSRPGSSPRVRGKRFRGVPCETATGLIPACAGKIQPLRG